MTYFDTDEHGDHMSIRARTDGVWITLNEGKANGSAFTVKCEDAPAVALAILEAAGIEPKDRDSCTETYTEGQWAVLKLRELAERHAEARAREAEDAKVRAWLRDICGVTSSTYRITDYDRAEYQRNAEFFGGAA